MILTYMYNDLGVQSKGMYMVGLATEPHFITAKDGALDRD